jgi:DNA-binding SARP family transcriptional activator
MEFRILGSLEAWRGDTQVHIGAAKQRALLAILLLNADEIVSTDSLVDQLWGDEPPERAVKTVQVYVSQLRKALAPGDGAEGGIILTRPPGYLLRLAPDGLDLRRFERLSEAGRRLLEQGDARAASARLGEALSLWRGPPLADFAYEPFAQVEIARLEELRLVALEDRAEADLRAGRAAELVGELEALVAGNPLRERFRGQLMLALYRSGRQAEALEVYRDGRAALVDELGIEPGKQLRALEQAILRQDAELEPPADRAAGARSPRQERKLVTLLCLGPPPKAASPDDPEELDAAFARESETIRKFVWAFGGMHHQRVGGATVVAFGAPVAHEDDAERAVRAALRAVDRGIAASAGVASAEALVSMTVGRAERISGRAVADAIELQRSAATGAVIVDELTASASEGRIEYRRLRRADGDCWQALAERPAAAARDARASRSLIGRDRELAMLEALRASVCERRDPRLMTVVGQAGIGKTRLVEEFAGALEEQASAVVLRGRCLAYGEGITYWPLREVLWEAAGIVIEDDGPAAGTKLRRLVCERLGHSAEDLAAADRVTHAVALTAGITLTGNPLEDASPEFVAHELELAWPRLLSMLAADRPTIVVVEDLHWAESPLLDMLELVVARSSGPLLVVATARPELLETRPAWGARPEMSQVGLAPLSANETRELVAGLLPAADASLRERVVTTAEGNPFFAEEIARHIGERRLEAAGTLPLSVRAVIAARLDALPDAERAVLSDAAVVGRSFWVTTLEAIRPERSAREAVRELEAKGLLVTRPGSSLAGETEMAFRHALIREVAYTTIPRAHRCRAHQSVARWLERVSGDRRSEFVELLAHHYEAAADPGAADLAWPADSPEREELRDQAVQALLAAADGARRRLQTDEAVRYAERAIALAPGDVERLAALELKAGALHDAVRADDAFSAYLEALELARRIEAPDTTARLRAQAALLCAYVWAFTGDDWKATAGELVEQGLRERGEDGVDFETGALLIGRTLRRQWRHEPADAVAWRRDLRRVVEIANAIDSPDLLAAGLDAHYSMALQEGLCELAALGERLVAAAERIKDPPVAHESLVTGSNAFFFAGRFEDARLAADRAVAQAAELSTHRRLHAVSVQSACLVVAGQIRELLDATADVVDLVREEGERTCPHGGLALSRRALALYESNDPEAAASTVDFLDSAMPLRNAGAFLYRAVELLQPFRGPEWASRSVERIEGQPIACGDATSKLRALLKLCALDGDGNDLDDVIASARRASDSLCAPFLGWIADWAQAVRLVRAGTTAEGAALAQEAAAALEGFGEPYTAARLLVDVLPFLDAERRRTLGQQSAMRLERMGARASAHVARRLSESAPVAPLDT